MYFLSGWFDLMVASYTRLDAWQFPFRGQVSFTIQLQVYDNRLRSCYLFVVLADYRLDVWHATVTDFHGVFVKDFVMFVLSWKVFLYQV